MKKKYIIGTRGSLLALTQCGQIKDELEKLTGDEFELKIIKTTGDEITNAPLWQLDGKDFFTKELDEALLKKEIDLVVHSYKDLGSVRPSEITLAAITERQFSEDILLIKKSTIKTLKEKKEFIVGTSSPRRITNIEKNLKKFIPHHADMQVKTKVLRGNVNTRIQKLIDQEFDAIVLAYAGIERLAKTESSKIILKDLVKDLNFFILPESYFPSSAAQGALAIECLKDRSDSDELLNKLLKLNHSSTIEEVKREREAFVGYGGGCHLPIGINVKKINNLFLHTHRGLKENQEFVFSKIENRNLPEMNFKKIFVGLAQYDDHFYKKTELTFSLAQRGHLILTAKYGYNSIMANQDKIETLFTSGTKTLEDMAKLGIWVNGSSDGLGILKIEKYYHSHFLNLMMDKNLPHYYLSHSDAKSLKDSKIIPVYAKSMQEIPEDSKIELRNTEIFFWTSFDQYLKYSEVLPEIKYKVHACGLGKTFFDFVEHQINVLPFTNHQEFLQWTKYESKN